uniref:Uncharacterized protein n=1 Tax=Meloidogyne hapla TaxID=6305 RepID=A0A1I8BT37_MELHA
MPNCVADSNPNFLSPKTIRSYDRRSKSSEFYIIPNQNTIDSKILPTKSIEQQQQPLLDRVNQLVEKFSVPKKGSDICSKNSCGSFYKASPSVSSSGSSMGSTDSSNSIPSSSIYHYPPSSHYVDVRRPSLPANVFEGGMLHSSASSSSTDSTSSTAVASEPGTYSSLLRTLRTQAASGTLVSVPERSPSPRTRFVRNNRNTHNNRRRQQQHNLQVQRQQTPPPQINIICGDIDEEEGNKEENFKEDLLTNKSVGSSTVFGSIQRRKKVLSSSEQTQNDLKKINEGEISEGNDFLHKTSASTSPKSPTLSRGKAQKMSLISKPEIKNSENNNSLSLNSASISDFRAALACKQINEEEVIDNNYNNKKYFPRTFANNSRENTNKNINNICSNSSSCRSSADNYFNEHQNVIEFNKNFNKSSSPPLSPTSISSLPLSAFPPQRLGSQKFISTNSTQQPKQTFEAPNNKNNNRRRSGFEGMLTGGGAEWRVFRQMARILKRDNNNSHRRGDSQVFAQQSPPVSPFFGNCANRRRYSLAPSMESSEGQYGF